MLKEPNRRSHPHSSRLPSALLLACTIALTSMSGCTWLQREPEDSSQAQEASGAPANGGQEKADGESAGPVGEGSMDITPESIMEGDQKEKLKKDDRAASDK